MSISMKIFFKILITNKTFYKLNFFWSVALKIYIIYIKKEMNQKKDASDDRDKLKQAVIFLTNNV
jgi:hypothetical protein